MNLDQIDWDALERLRAAFLSGSAGQRDYWQSDRDLASYDQTFAQRIGWKWAHVFRELDACGWTPPPASLWDWGCGTGIAGRVFLNRYGVGSVSRLFLTDRSLLALDFARRQATEQFAGLGVEIGIPANPGTVLLSHVLTELNDKQLKDLMALLGNAQAVLWVEPGTHDTSRRLSHVRDQLCLQFRVVSPCTHQSGCPMLRAQHENHWCHHFAAPPPEVFTDGSWARFGSLAGIDLRSLPLSFLVLDKRLAAETTEAAVRLIGHPRLYKAHAMLLGCDESGLHDRRLSKRRLPETFRLLKKGRIAGLQLWRWEGDEIIEMQPHRDSLLRPPEPER